MAINTNTVRADIFKEFYKVIKDNITTPNVVVTNALVDDIKKMPQVVIDAPSISHKREGFGNKYYDRSGDFEINIYATKMKDVVELVDDVENAIFSNLGSLSVQNLSIDDSDIMHFQSGGQFVHSITLPMTFTFKR